VALTDELWRQLVSVNDLVNRDIRPATDREAWGREEWWDYPTVAGDCEDYALLKRRDLIQLGWPVGALLLTVLRQSNGDGHAVLTVLTGRGDLILDNLRSPVELWSDTDCQFIKRQARHDTGSWVSIADDHLELVGSIRQ
jgi:predicted transglutaminase-like cysteine proteinase